VFLIDQPGAVQANIFAGAVIAPTRDPSPIRFDMANTVIGGHFTARLNMNQREDTHGSYGADSSASGALAQRPWIASAPLQIDRTADTVAEMQRELSDCASGTRPVTEAELGRAKAINTLSLAGAYETAWSVMLTIGGNVRYGRP